MRFLITMMLISTVGLAQRKMTSEGEERVRIAIKEKQNKVAKDIPRLLLKAWCEGEITAYYTNSHKTEMSYANFLAHFGMEDRAYLVLDNQVPDWYCKGEPLKCIPIDEFTMSCLQYEIELGEENYFNQQRSTQEKRIEYVKLIFYSECSYSGIELEGPVFKISDIKKLDKQKYKVRNAKNDAVSLPIWSFLTLGNFNRTTIYKKDEFVDNPARVSKEELQKRVTRENENWER